MPNIETKSFILRRVEKMSSNLNSEPMQEVFQTYTGRCWKGVSSLGGRGGQLVRLKIRSKQ